MQTELVGEARGKGVFEAGFSARIGQMGRDLRQETGVFRVFCLLISIWGASLMLLILFYLNEKRLPKNRDLKGEGGGWYG